ncbi:MAG: HlyD family efflux transporter periplasmic adaptor subunit [Pseudomonadales bacterium]|nr:HlyD family efflux transporter periplasmic adaptor subunit [Pseudomonadales bacterium]
MDVPLERKPYYRRWRLVFVGTAALLLFGIIITQTLSPVVVSADDIEIQDVQHGVMEDNVKIVGYLSPEESYTLATSQNGVVQSLLYAEGDLVSKGDLIAELGNPLVRLEVTAREAQVAEQVYFLREVELAISRESLELERELLDIDHDIERLRKEMTRFESLKSRSLYPEFDLEKLGDELELLYDQKRIVQLRYENDKVQRERQEKELRNTISRLDGQMSLARSAIDELQLKSPINGRIAEISVEKGMQLLAGAEVATIDSVGDFFVEVSVPEFYLSNMEVGKQAIGRLDDGLHELVVTKISPNVSNGAFKVRFDFLKNSVEDRLFRGQSLEVRFDLGSSQRDSRLFTHDKFVVESAHGTYVYLLDQENRNLIERQAVEIGRSSGKKREITSGLKRGDSLVRVPEKYFGEEILRIDVPEN